MMISLVEPHPNPFPLQAYISARSSVVSLYTSVWGSLWMTFKSELRWYVGLMLSDGVEPWMGR